jgi:FkbM family methyltransferase
MKAFEPPSATASGTAPGRQTFAQTLCRALPPILAYRLATNVFMPRAPRSESPFVTRTITGALFGYHGGDILANQVRACGFWDWRMLAIAKALCADGGTILEIGANTGTETVSLATIVGQKGRVYAFEPEPSIFDALEANVRLNKFQNVRLFRLAIGDRRGAACFSPAARANNSGQGFLDLGRGENSFDVPVATLDDEGATMETPRADLVIVDVEGHEIAVLRGARKYLRKHRPTLVLEAVAEQLERAGQSLSQLIDEVNALAYDVWAIHRVGIAPFPPTERMNREYHRNLLCLPRERARREAKVVAAMIRRCAFSPAFLNPLA